MAIMTIGGFVAGKIVGKVALPLVGLAIDLTTVTYALLNKDTEKKLEEVRNFEGCQHIKVWSDWWMNSPTFNAQAAAVRGKTTWETKNGLWVYHDQHDYNPKFVGRMLLRPIKQNSNGYWQIEEQSPRQVKKLFNCRECQAAQKRK